MFEIHLFHHFHEKIDRFINISFTGNVAFGNGGAVLFYLYDDDGFISNCSFTDNRAGIGNGGAVYFSGNGKVVGCSFTGNAAFDKGGAIVFNRNSDVLNCNFTGNNATAGSAIYLSNSSATRTISNSTFLNNRANAADDNPFNVTVNENNITITFMGQNNLINAIYSNRDVSFANVTYWAANGISNTDSSSPTRSNREAGQNITVAIIVGDNIVLNAVRLTDAEGTVVL